MKIIHSEVESLLHSLLAAFFLIVQIDSLLYTAKGHLDKWLSTHCSQFPDKPLPGTKPSLTTYQPVSSHIPRTICISTSRAVLLKKSVYTNGPYYNPTTGLAPNPCIPKHPRPAELWRNVNVIIATPLAPQSCASPSFMSTLLESVQHCRPHYLNRTCFASMYREKSCFKSNRK